jgi:hypothetical protein
MKKILILLCLSLMLTNAAFFSKVWASEIPVYPGDLPIWQGNLNKVEYRTIYEGEDFIVVEIDGKSYIFKTEK